MNSEIRMSGGSGRNKWKFYGYLGSGLGLVIFASMILFPLVWTVGLYTTFALAGATSALFLWRGFYLFDHERQMLGIERDSARNDARLKMVAQGMMVYDALEGRMIAAPAAGQLMSGEVKFEVYFERRDSKTGAISRGSVFGINPVHMQQFAQAILDGTTTFTEANAARYKITQTPFNEWRDFLIKSGEISWKNERNHNLGLDFTDDFLVRLEEIVATPLPR